MAIDYLNKNGLSYFWSKLKVYFAPKAHTHTAFEMKHSYTTAANAAKNWYRIANANTSQTDTTKPIHAQFILTAYNASYDAGYYERWFVNAEVFGRNAHIVILGNTAAPFSQARILYENTIADLDANDRPAIDIYLNYQLANGTTKIEIEEVYNSGWTFAADGQLAASTVPSGFESVASAPRNNGVDRSSTADYATYLNRQISNFTAAFTLADSYLYRSRTLNCTGTFTITIPSINSGYMWCVIKNKNTSSGAITLHPSTTSVLIDGSNANITLQPMEYVCIHSAGANNYSLIADGRWKSQKADKATTLAGYGITDAKIANGTITLGSNSITPLTSDSNFVHKTGDEIIDGYKGFNSIYVAKRLAGVTRGTIPQTTQYSDWAFDDVDGHLLGCVELACRDASSTEYGNSRADLKLWCKPVDANPGDSGAFLTVGWDDQGRRFAACPSTSETRTYDNDILTRNWIPKDDRIVHTSGDEVIAGNKTFTWNQYLKDDSAAYDSSTGGGYSLVFKDKNDVEVGRVQNMYSSSDNCTLLRVYLRDRSRDYQVGLRDSGTIYFGPRGTGSSGTINLGQAGNYWKEVFAYSSAINTSDARLKRNIVNISDVVLDAWENIDWKQFKMVDAIEAKGEDRARWHTGLVAQDLDKVFSGIGLEIRDYGFFCYDEWQAEPRIEKDGEVLNEGREAGNQYALRYIEALSIEAAYQRRENARLKKRIADLEERLAALELKVS